MSKGRLTRDTILQTAFEQASQQGLESLTIGSLATACEMSKSGLFAHFQSRVGCHGTGSGRTDRFLTSRRPLRGSLW